MRTGDGRRAPRGDPGRGPCTDGERCHASSTCANRCARSEPRSARTMINPALLTAPRMPNMMGDCAARNQRRLSSRMFKEGADDQGDQRPDRHSRGLTRKASWPRSDIFRVRSRVRFVLHRLEAGRAMGGGGVVMALELRRLQRQGQDAFASPKRRERRFGIRKMHASAMSCTPSARTIARLMTIERDCSPKPRP